MLKCHDWISSILLPVYSADFLHLRLDLQRFYADILISQSQQKLDPPEKRVEINRVESCYISCRRMDDVLFTHKVLTKNVR